MYFNYVILIACVIFTTVQSKIPDYIHVCKRKDPNINNCIINSVEQLRPKLIKGIPELDVPALEPLHLPEVVISRGGAFRAVGSNILVHGAGSFEITGLKANVEDITYQIGVRFPKMTFDAIYDVNVRLLTVPLKGKGPINANATNIEGNGILKGHKEVKSNGKTYVIFDSLDLKLKMKNYSVRLENLFNGDKALGEAVNRALNENKREMMSMLRPQAERTVSAVLLDIANKITNHFEYDELFPM
ncbi:protein takeout-like [Rhodnius prolixus]|uniref:Hemolymph juvenile hormone binding protein n=1 Tax=Rhodnius prolixus TaxID=13249 RepID=R4FK69_RHOPR